MKNIILFGAGNYGKAAVKHYGKENIRYFVDNNKVKQNTYILGIPVISPERMTEINKEGTYHIVIASRHHKEIENQLKDMGIRHYEIYFLSNGKRYYPTTELVLNPYEDGSGGEVSEKAYNEITKNNPLMKSIREEVNRLYKDVPMFSHIEIETINRCNGICSFCPINSQADSREKKVMSRELFEKIIDELAGLKYDGRIALFSNNEPMLDDRIIDLYRHCRNKLPEAWLFMFTNGTLLSLEKCKQLLPLLDELIIDNYNQELQLIPNSQKIVQYCETNEELRNKVIVILRKPNEILSSRGGDAPNRADMVKYADSTCVLPFKQMIVRPDGKVSLCCNDPLGKNTLGDLTKESLVDIWYGKKFRQVREALFVGRSQWEHCVYCDAFSVG